MYLHFMDHSGLWAHWNVGWAVAFSPGVVSISVDTQSYSVVPGPPLTKFLVATGSRGRS